MSIHHVDHWKTRLIAIDPLAGLCSMSRVDAEHIGSAIYGLRDSRRCQKFSIDNIGHFDSMNVENPGRFHLEWPTVQPDD